MSGEIYMKTADLTEKEQGVAKPDMKLKTTWKRQYFEIILVSASSVLFHQHTTSFPMTIHVLIRNNNSQWNNNEF